MELWNSVKRGIVGKERDIFIIASFIFVALIAFGLGRLSVLVTERIPIRVETPDSR